MKNPGDGDLPGHLGVLRRYHRGEPGSAAVRAVCRPTSGNDLLIAHFTTVELASALGRRIREGSLPHTNAARMWRMFLKHRRTQYRVITVTDRVVSNAAREALTGSARALDAIHIAVAGEARRTSPASFVFWTADRRQAAAAVAQGLTVHLVQ